MEFAQEVEIPLEQAVEETRRASPGTVAFHGVGRRKEAVARVYLKEGDGRITVNGRPAAAYFSAFAFGSDHLNRHLLSPFYATGTIGRYAVRARVEGGGHGTTGGGPPRDRPGPRRDDARVQEAPQGRRAPHPRRPRRRTEEVRASQGTEEGAVLQAVIR